MERKAYFLILWMLPVFVFATAPDYKTRIYNAYIGNNMKDWKIVIDALEAKKNKTTVLTAELLNYQYGYIGWCMGNKNYKEAGHYIALGEKNIATLEKAGYQLSAVNAYKAAFYGFRIGLNKLQAPFLGPKSIEHAKAAIKLDANNPYGYIQLGNSDYYMPAAFGGSKTRALEYYIKAATLMENNAYQSTNNWNYLGLLTQIAMAYEELKMYPEAKKYYLKIIKIEPKYLWVKEELYPAFLKKLS
ncbi:MAG: hypothetical protein JXB34_06255 [Bacteroidales bacterium]|nr:hypothetical protein [Bacteroidales bacterium]